ncbi:MAG: DUF3592 domain-containing protein [Acidobacteriota bacterium]|nr:DUF3592 domain-containing protein [Acidobacteriota bacterium]
MQPNLASPPRHVPLSLQIVNFFNGFAQAGWLVFGFGMIFFWAFVTNADFSFANFRGPHGTADGKVTRVEGTSASINRREVQANHYEYSVAGDFFEGVSYSTGQSVSAGESVMIEYDDDDPARSRIAGQRRAMFGAGLIFVSLFPFIGLLILIPSTLSGIKRNRLLREGIVAPGTLKSKSRTNMRINNRLVYELIFEFTTRDGRRQEAKARTTDTDRLQDETEEPLLYDPTDPSRAYLLDEAPARPEIESNGDLRGRPTAAVRSLIIPLLVIGAHGAVLLIKML